MDTINDVTNNSWATFAQRADAYSSDLASPHLSPTAGSPGSEAQSLRSDLESGALAAAGISTYVNARG